MVIAHQWLTQNIVTPAINDNRSRLKVISIGMGTIIM